MRIPASCAGKVAATGMDKAGLVRQKIDELPVAADDTLVGVLDVRDLLAADFDDVDRDK